MHEHDTSGELAWRVDLSETYELATQPDVLVARRAAEQWGVLSARELRQCGLSADAVAVRVRNGRLHRLHRGVYAVGHTSLPPEARFLAAVKACGPTAVLSHFSAAALWGIVRWSDRYPEVTVAGGGTRGHASIRVHRSAQLTTSDITRRHGILVTMPARTLVDLAATLGRQPLRRAVRQAQSLQRAHLPQIAAAMRRAGRRHGTTKLANIIATGPAPTRSELEDVVLDLILHARLRHPDVNRPLIIDGHRVVPDFRWPAERLVLEADGAAWHDNPTAREDDAERQATLERHGERVIRVTWKQAITRPAETIARIRAAGAPPAQSSVSR
jgi:very-short-patch-repair endonuclease/predicted transcriptional regulator of viral defense system